MSFDKNSRLIFYARLAMKMGDHLIAFAVPLLVFESTQSAKWAGFALFIERMPRVLILPFCGYISDRVGSRTVMIVSDAIRFAALSLIFFLALANSSILSIGLPLVASVIAVMNAQTFVALEAFLSNTFHDSMRTKMMIRLQIVEQASVVAAPLIGFAVQKYAGAFYILFVAAVFFGLSMIVLLFTSYESPIDSSNTNNGLLNIGSDLLKAWREVLQNRRLLKFAFAAGSLNFIGGLDISASAPILLGKLKMQSISYGYLQLICGVASLIFMSILPRLKFEKYLDWAGFIGFVFIILGAILASVSSTFFLFTVAIILSNLPMGILNVYIRTRRSELIVGANRGTKLGVLLMLGQSGIPLGGLLLAIVNASFGSSAFLIAASTGVVSCYLLFSRQIQGFLAMIFKIRISY